MSLTNEKQQAGEPFYRREFKQEQFLYEETSNLASEESTFSEPFQYLIMVFVGLLFVGCLGLLMLDLLLPRLRDNANAERRRRSRPLNAVDQHSPILPRREQSLPRDDPFMQVPPREVLRGNLHRRRVNQPANHRPNEAARGKPSSQNAFDDSAAEELPDRPIGYRHNNSLATPNGTNS